MDLCWVDQGEINTEKGKISAVMWTQTLWSVCTGWFQIHWFHDALLQFSSIVLEWVSDHLKEEFATFWMAATGKLNINSDHLGGSWYADTRLRGILLCVSWLHCVMKSIHPFWLPLHIVGCILGFYFCVITSASSRVSSHDWTLYCVSAPQSKWRISKANWCPRSGQQRRAH